MVSVQYAVCVLLIAQPKLLNKKKHFKIGCQIPRQLKTAVKKVAFYAIEWQTRNRPPTVTVANVRA